MRFFSSHILLAALILPLHAFSFRLDPMVVELQPTGPKNSHSFRVENNGQERIAVQLKMTTRTTDENGKETRLDSSDFTIYPEQISLSPNDMRTVRVTYNGPKDVTSEKAYRLIASQLPVNFQKETKPTQLNFLFQYIASVYITPKGAAAQVQVKDIKVTDKNKIEFKLENVGTAHRLLKGIQVQFYDKNNLVAIDPNFFKGIANENILAGASRKLTVDATSKISSKTVLTAKVEITE